MNFTNKIRLTSVSFLALFLASCTEIIDITTNAVEPQLVVEANIALNEHARVLLSKSIDLNQPNNFEKVTNALIRITDNTGKTELLTEMSDGVYTSQTLIGEQGKTYSLVIESRQKTITAQCKIPPAIPIDSFSVVNSIYPGGGPPRGNQPAPFYEVKLTYTDPADQSNYYRFVLYYNDNPQSRNSIVSDQFSNGKVMESTLILYNDSAKAGDRIRIELQCIDYQIYNYFQSMGSAAMGPGNSSSPANPYTNLSGAILGYFSAHTVERKEFVLKK